MARLLFRLLGESNSPSPVPDPSTAAVTSDLVIVLAALLCAMICFLGLIAVSRCVWLRRLAAGNRTHAGSQGGSGQSPPPPVAAANKGLKNKVLQSLPKLTFSPESPSSEKFTECAICLTEFSNGDELRILPQCHKCGGLPGSSSSGPEPEIEIRIKQGEDDPNSFLP
ncbi:BnaC07g15130D [Brassica napus]|uniref:BnaC07g15130D protein n=1 Tax=Brassica napus TaxID=3708 RepID=A0A078H4T4_BRANA|nr:BnaC07g15130D [Brassica napus]